MSRLLYCGARNPRIRLSCVRITVELCDDTAVDGKLILLDGSSTPADAASVQAAMNNGSLLWLDLHQAGEDGIALLRDVFHLHPLALDDVT